MVRPSYRPFSLRSSVGLGLAWLAVFQSLASSQSIKLNGPLVRPNPDGPIRGDVQAFQSAARAGLVVYLADQDHDEVFGLYSARLDGSERPRRLTAALASGSIASDFVVSSDGELVAFKHLPIGAASYDLYVVASRGGLAPIRLDGSRPILPPLSFSAGNARLVYSRDLPTELCSVPVDGSSPPTTLSAGLPTPEESNVEDFQLSADGTLVVFRVGFLRTGYPIALYSVPVDGSSLPRRLSGSGDVAVRDFRIAPDGRNVAYVQDGGLPGRNLFSASTDGSRAPDRLNAKFVGIVGSVAAFAITSDSRTVVFVADRNRLNRFRVYSAPIDGRRPRHGSLDGTLHTDDPINLTPMGRFNGVATRTGYTVLRLSADGTRAVYRADAITDGFIELFSVTTDGSGAPVALNPPLVTVGDFALAPDQQHVVFAGYGHDGEWALFGAPLAGGPAIVIDDLPGLAYPEFFQIAPDSSFVMYVAQHDDVGTRELFAVPLEASKLARRLNGALPAGREVLYDFVPLSGGRALYRADEDADDVLELFEGFFGHALPGRRF
jgi:Tol biopolymer transport system component